MSHLHVQMKHVITKCPQNELFCALVSSYRVADVRACECLQSNGAVSPNSVQRKHNVASCLHGVSVFPESCAGASQSKT